MQLSIKYSTPSLWDETLWHTLSRNIKLKKKIEKMLLRPRHACRTRFDNVARVVHATAPPYNPGSDVIRCECTVRTVRTIFYLTPCNGGKIFYFTPVYVQYVQFLSNVIQCTYCTCIVGYKLRR